MLPRRAKGCFPLVLDLEPSENIFDFLDSCLTGWVAQADSGLGVGVYDAVVVTAFSCYLSACGKNL